MSRGERLGVAMIGYSFMGAAHSQAWRSVNHFFDVGRTVEMTAVCGRDEQGVAAAAERLGWASHETDWRAVLARDDVDLVDVCTPGSTHAEIAIAALEAGKHVLCEKPLANTVAEASAMTQAAAGARAHGVRSMVGFNYRRVPALAHARALVAAGRLGTIRHVRAQYLQDWLVDPEFPLTWRLQADTAGSGALGDLGAHIVDLVQHLTGTAVSGVSALTETFVHERPLPDGGGVGPVTVDDAVLFLARLDGGALATFEATRFATGRRNGLRVELNGDRGSLVFDLERLNELELYDATDSATEQGFRRILVTEPEHPYLAAWWPPGHILGYEHTFTHEVRDLVEAISTGHDPQPSFETGEQVQRVLDAVTRSAAAGSGWTETS